MSLRTNTTDWSVTAAAEGPTGKFTYELNPKSGADVWVKAPTAKFGYPSRPDMHFSLAEAEEIGYLLLQAVEDAKKAA